MSTQTEILRLESARNTLRTKGAELGITLPTDKLDAIATKFDTNLSNRGAVSATVKEGETYTIAKGYHNGSGTVAGVTGGGQYTLQSKSVTPTKSQQNVTSDDGYYGLSDVTVGPIPENFQDVSAATAAAEEVLVNKTFVNTSGTAVGTMPNVGTATKLLDGVTPAWTIPKGYHDGKGRVYLQPEEKAATPGATAQDITPSEGKLISKVTVGAIPSQYKDATGTDAVAANVLAGKKAVTIAGGVTGTMADNAAVAVTMDGLSTTEYTIAAGYHNGSGKVSLSNDIETALAAI